MALAHNQGRNLVFRVLACGQVLHVAVIAGHHDQAVLRPVLQHTGHHPVEAFQHGNPVFERPPVADDVRDPGREEGQRALARQPGQASPTLARGVDRVSV